MQNGDWLRPNGGPQRHTSSAQSIGAKQGISVVVKFLTRASKSILPAPSCAFWGKHVLGARPRVAYHEASYGCFG